MKDRRVRHHSLHNGTHRSSPSSPSFLSPTASGLPICFEFFGPFDRRFLEDSENYEITTHTNTHTKITLKSETKENNGKRDQNESRTGSYRIERSNTDCSIYRYDPDLASARPFIPPPTSLLRQRRNPVDYCIIKSRTWHLAVHSLGL